MSTVQVKALLRFEHNTTRNAGDVFPVSDKHAEQLVAKGLCTLATDPTASDSDGKDAARQKTAQQNSTQTKREPKTDKTSAQAKTPTAEPGADAAVDTGA